MSILAIGRRHIVRGMAYAADLFDGTKYSDVVNMKNNHQAEIVVNLELGSTGTAILTVQACDNTTPSNRSAIPFHYQKVTGADDVPGAVTAAAAAGFTTTAGATAQIYRLFVDAADLAASGYAYFQLEAVEVVDDPVAGSVLIILDQPRNAEAIPDSVIV